MLTFSALPALAADEAALSKDLTAVIASQGLPCGKVVKIETQAERDYLVACQEGSNYQIVANAQGKLTAQPLGKKIH
jgi:aminoglycoside phosphotransferase